MIDFIQFANSHGLVINSLPLGKVVRCATYEHKTKRNGAYYFDGLFGWAMDWSKHDRPIIWKSDSIKDDTVLRKKVQASKAQYEQERARANQEAAQKAQWILSQCELNLSAYLGRKGFPEMSANIWTPSDSPVLVIPMYRGKDIAGCQLIDRDGNKKFLKGQATQDAYFQIGNGKITFFVEGYVSGLSLQRVLEACKVSYKILITFSASNLLRFAKRIDGIVIADNDASKTGENAAIESSRKWWMPPIVGYDINDYCLAHGTFKPVMAIRNLIYAK